MTDNQKDLLLNIARNDEAVLRALKGIYEIQFDEDIAAEKARKQTEELFDKMVNIAKQRKKRQYYRFAVNSETRDKLERYCITNVLGGYVIGYDNSFCIYGIAVVVDEGMSENCFVLLKEIRGD